MMNARSSFAPLLLGAALLLGGPAGCSVEEPPLKGALIGGPFRLTNEDGGTTSDRDFDGKYRLIYFGYTYCPDVCPVDVQKLMQGLARLEKTAPAKAQRIQPIFITVDPARDTPAVLKAFTDRYHPRLIGLTGSEAAIAKVAQAYLMNYKKQPPGNPEAPGEYLVAHMQLAYLMSPRGEPVALIPVDDISTPDKDEGTPAIVAAELDRWVK